MGYKVNENSLASIMNFKYALWKGEPVQLLAVQQSGEYDPIYGRRYHYKLYARRIGKANDRFKVDPAEPTLSADAIQGGYCFDEAGKELAFLDIINGTARRSWATPGWDCNLEYYSKKLLDCVTGNAPSFKEAHEAVTSVTGRKKACHFDRDFALVRDNGFSDISVHYRGKQIGTYDPKTKKIMLRKGPTVKLLKRKLDRLTKEE